MLASGRLSSSLHPDAVPRTVLRPESREVVCAGKGIESGAGSGSKNRDLIGAERAIARRQDELFELGLGDEDSVERILVMMGKPSGMVGVAGGHGELEKAVGFDFGEGIAVDLELAELRLDRDFPDAGGADVDGRRRVGEGFACLVAELGEGRRSSTARFREDPRRRLVPAR